MTPRLVRFSDVYDRIQNGDLLLWRRGSWPMSRLIAGGDRSIYSHVGRVQRDQAGLWSLEFTQYRGAVRTLLTDHVRDYPGRIDVFRPQTDLFPLYSPRDAVAEMRRLMREFPGYGYWNVMRAARSVIPGWRLLTWSADDDSNGSREPHCADGASRCDRFAGQDPVPNTPSRNTTPGDFGRSLLYRYAFTLEGL